MSEVFDYLDDAVTEMKRVDHQVYVSLKYTRTVDVLLNIISRMIDGYEEMWNGLIQYHVEQNKVEEVPQAPLVKASMVLDLYDEEIIKDNVELYLLLRKLHRSNPEREQEFRRHVTLRTVIDGREEIVNIDIITQYYHMQKEFLGWLFKYFEEK